LQGQTVLLRGDTRLAVAVALAGLSASGAASERQAQVARERPAGLAVDFVAVSPDGTPVADLQPADVEIRINGRVRAIASLHRVTTARQTATSEIGSIFRPFGSNETAATGRTFAFVIDEESLLAGQMPLLRRAADGLLDSFGPGDEAAVASLPFGGIRSAFTSDTARTRLAIAGISGRGSRGETGSDLACRTRQFLESLELFLQRQAGRQSPMTVLVFTAGLAAPRRDAAMAEAPGMCELLVDHFRRITVAAGAARANFFVVQPDDLGTTARRWRESIGGTGYLGSDNPLEGIENLAGVTGGARLPLNATGTAALLRVAKESAAYYVAEIDRRRDDVQGRSRTLDVRVRRRDVVVRARPEITFLDAASPSRTRLALPDLIASRDAYSDVGLRAAAFTVREADGRLRVGVVVEPVDDLLEVASAGAALIDGDEIVARWAAGDTLARPLLGAMSAPEGRYRLRVVVIDKAGRVGAAEDVVDVGLTAVGPLSLGSLVLGLSRHDTLVPQLQFGTEPAAIASFDIYGGAAGMRISAAVEVGRSPDGPPIVSMPLALTRADDTRVVATGTVPIGALPAGDYVVRGVIRLEDGTTGRVLRALRKAPP
jgi:hypothetical protein